MKTPNVVIAIVTYRSADLTIDCLRSIESERVSSEMRIRAIVVDNASGDTLAIAEAVIGPILGRPGSSS